MNSSFLLVDGLDSLCQALVRRSIMESAWQWESHLENCSIFFRPTNASICQVQRCNPLTHNPYKT